MKVLGHRGAILNGEKPYQNSLEAFRLAVHFADGIETDAVMSRDGEVFLIHEAKYVHTQVEYALEEHLNLASQELLDGRRLDEMTANEISKLRLKDGSPIPTLKEALALFMHEHDKTLNIELKGDGVHAPVIGLLKTLLQAQLILPEQLIISSFNHEALAEVRRALPDITIGMLFVNPEQKETPLFPWKDKQLPCYQPLTKEAFQNSQISLIEPQLIIIPDSAATPENFNLIQEFVPDAKVVVWVFTELESYDETRFQAMIKEQEELLHAVIVDDPESKI